MTLSILDAGDTAFTIEFGNAIDPALQTEVDVLDHAIEHAWQQGELPGVIETVPTFRSLTVIYNPIETDRETLLARVMPLAQAATHTRKVPARHWRLPACYEGEAAPDLVETASALGIGTERLIALHTESEYVVYMLGFLPGFPFMGDLPEALRLPRRTEPRVRVPPGSIAIAAGLTAIYPWESPGGWHLLGRCPVPLFDPSRAQPALLRAGDRVRFTPISTAECARLDDALAAGEVDPAAWCHAETEAA